jgi:hypothetical protein
MYFLLIYIKILLNFLELQLVCLKDLYEVITLKIMII